MKIGIDLGGTKTEIAVLDRTGREVRPRQRVDSAKTYEGTISTIKELVRQAETEIGAECTVGIGIPGAISPATNRIKNANSTHLNGKPLHVDLAKALEREVRLANDANCFALSEARDGAAAGSECVFGVIIGTGTGGGVVFRNQILRGCNSIGGEWGHNPLPWPGDEEMPGSPCYCGKRGCIETWISGPGFSADYERATGAKRKPAEIVAVATPNSAERAALDRYMDRLARGLSTIINVLDPDVIVLGGGMGNVDALYAEVPPLLGKYVFSDRVDTLLRKPFHGDSSGVRGAALLW